RRPGAPGPHERRVLRDRGGPRHRGRRIPPACPRVRSRSAPGGPHRLLRDRPSRRRDRGAQRSGVERAAGGRDPPAHRPDALCAHGRCTDAAARAGGRGLVPGPSRPHRPGRARPAIWTARIHDATLRRTHDPRTPHCCGEPMTHPSHPTGSAIHRPDAARPSRRAGVAAASALALAVIPAMSANLLLGASVFEDIHKGFPDTGTAVTAAALRGAADLAALVSLGAVVSVLFLHPRTPRGAGRLRFGPDMSILTWSSGVWAALAAANVLVSAPESNGVPLSRLAELGAFGPLYTFGYMPRAWTVTTVGAAVLWLCSYWSTRWTTLLPGLWAGVVGASAPVVVGQVLVGPHHDVGSDAGTIQLLAAALLLGPVLVAEGIRWLSRDPSRRGPLDVHLLLRTAVFGTWIVLAMDLVLMWFMLAGTRPWDSMTGLLFLIRLALLAALLATLTTARRRSPHRTLEPALLIVLWLAVGSAMTRIPPPQYFVPTSIQQVFMGFEVTAPPSLGTLAGEWRLNLLFA